MNKNYFSYLLFFSALFFGILSCSNDEHTGHIEILEIDLDNPHVGFLAKSSSKLIDVKTDAETLYFENTPGWVNASYDEAREAIAISVLDNASLKSRNADIIVKNKSIQDTITIIQFGVEPEIILNDRQIIIDFKAQRINLNLLSNLDLQANPQAAWINKVENLKNVSIEPTEYAFAFDIDALKDDLNRDGKIILKHEEADIKDTITISQKVVINDYEPENTSSFEKDKNINIISATLTPADKYQTGSNIDNTIDGDYSTIFHSPWSGMPEKPAIEMEFTLDPEEAEVANYLLLYPRPAGNNGIIKTATVWVTTESNGEYEKIADVEATSSNSPVLVQFDAPILKPRSFKIGVTDAYSWDEKYYVSLAEFRCYESKSLTALENDQAYFTDETFSELAPGVTVQDLPDISNPFLQNIAAHLLSGKYDNEYRVQPYTPFREVSDLANELKTSGYSQFENPTGIYFNKNDEVILFVEDPNGQNINLRVKDFGPSGDDHTYNLRKGLNVLSMKGQGNGYISYYTPDYETAADVTIHIASGQINGYFDISKHSNQDGKNLLENAVSEIMDIKGERVQLAYSVNSLKNNSYERLRDLTIVYDSIVSSQQTIMGLRKYNRLPKNHMLGRVIWDGYMHADGWGAAFHDNTMNSIANPDNLKNNLWGPAHEFGHVNQTRPGLRWVGTTEVTNNIFSVWSQFCYTPHHLRLEHENIGGIVGGRINAYFNNAFINNQEWSLQAGPDATYGPNNNGAWGGDFFVRLVPLWQLQLFFHLAGEGNQWHRPYFWADVFEAVRNTDESGVPHGQLQMNFVKNVCDAVQYDLTDFFTRIGMLQEVDKIFDDYTSRRKTITANMINETINYISRYPKPELNNTLQYITGNSYITYRDKLPMSGSYSSGVQVLTDQLKVKHANWENVVVFETYEGEELTHITMVGTGDASNATTTIPWPENATKVDAVGYDGKRILVYEK